MAFVPLLLILLAQAQASLAIVERALAHGQYAAALDELKAKPANTFHWHLLASKAYDGVNDPKQAVIEAEAALALEPRNESAHLQLGQIFLSRNTPEAAYEVFSEALEIFPQSFVVRLGKGLALKEMGRYQESIAELRQCMAERKDSGLTFDALGTAMLHSQDFVELQKIAQEFVKNAAGDYRGYYYLATAREGLNLDDKESLQLLGTSIRLNPKFAASLSLMGKIRLRHNEAAAAMALLEQAVGLRPDHVMSHLTLAKAYKALGKESEARQEFELVRSLREKDRLPRPTLLYRRQTN
jgi:protein O-GlcNAc transferase